MKITARQYAQGLYEAVAGKNEKEAKEILNDFVLILAADNKLKKAGEIIEQFNKIYNEKNGIVDAEITTAKEISKEVENELAGYIKQLTKAEKIILIKKADKDILGGVIIKYRSTVLDGSLKNKLAVLKNRMIK